jgi:hypothetical protein
MSVNSFFLEFSWGDRGHGPAEMGELILRSAEALREINPLFETWWFVDAVVMKYVPLDEVRARIAELVKQGVALDDDGEPEPQSGYMSTIVNETEGTPNKVNLRIHDGIRNGKEFFRNSGVFSTEYKMVPDPTLITYPAFKSVMMTLVRIWGASSAQAACDDLRDGSPEARRFFAPNWMTYLAPPLLARVTPPTGVLCERTPDGGLLMIAAEETFDARNPDHMDAARTISDALLPLTMKEFWF